PIVESRYGWLSTTICYDTYFPALVRQAGAGRTAILINPTNDTRPFAESALSIATLRAVENGCALLRPTGGGISAVIDWKGRVVARQSAFDDASGVMPARIPVGGVRTLYSLIGDLFAYLCAAGLLAVAALALLRRRA
ncbi:MAG TPA: nitrilase-related carbon-nitrogen hydrolase, partial [Spirochaetia bacterium]